MKIRESATEKNETSQELKARPAEIRNCLSDYINNNDPLYNSLLCSEQSAIHSMIRNNPSLPQWTPAATMRPGLCPFLVLCVQGDVTYSKAAPQTGELLSPTC